MREDPQLENDNKKDTESVKEFWNKRAVDFGSDCSATLAEKYLRFLEIRTMLKLIKKYDPRHILDIGCGNGYSTMTYASKLKNIDYIGLDYSAEMIRVAQQENSSENIEFMVGDVLDISTFPNQNFDLIISQRVIQNIANYEDQKEAIENLLRKKSNDGVILLMECSKQGLENLQKWRRKIGRSELENIEPWHNKFIQDEYIKRDFGAEIYHFTSTYMVLTRLVSQRLQRIAYRMPAVGQFGYEKLYVIQ